MGRVILAGAAVMVLWYAYTEYKGPGTFRMSGGGSSTPFGGMSKAPGQVVGGAVGAAAKIGN